MKTRWINLFWGLVLVVVGGLYLLNVLGYITIDRNSPQLWIPVFGAFSLLFFATYFIQGVAHWGWLFPALIFGALSLLLAQVAAGADNAAMSAPVLAAVGIPFLVAFALEPRKRQWALIPASCMTVLTLIVTVVDRVPGEVIGGLVLFSIGLPFLVVYLVNRSRWWALIPALILIVLGAVTLLSSQAPEFMGALVLFGIALPFFVIYIQSAKHWWALMTAGILTSLALIALITAVSEVAAEQGGVLGGVLFLGIAITFLVLWLRRASHPTDWAVYPAVVAGLAALIAFILGSRAEIVGPVVIITVGAVLLFLALRPKKTA